MVHLLVLFTSEQLNKAELDSFIKYTFLVCVRVVYTKTIISLSVGEGVKELHSPLFGK